MTNHPTKTSMAKSYGEEVSPDSLMSDFRGRPLVAIVAFTVIIHVVLIGVFSFGYLKNQLFGEDTSSSSEEERMEVAVREATSSLRDIAERHGVSPQDLSERFATGGSPSMPKPTPSTTGSDDQDTPTGTGETPTDEPESAIEKELQEKKDGPDLPDLPSIEDEDDLF